MAAPRRCTGRYRTEARRDTKLRFPTPDFFVGTERGGHQSRRRQHSDQQRAYRHTDPSSGHVPPFTGRASVTSGATPSEPRAPDCARPSVGQRGAF
jgi:hypothetical protein